MSRRKRRSNQISDQPIFRSKDDKLHRKGLANQLADDIRRWKGKATLTVGLYGAWGSGKSSLKNLVVERLRKSRAKKKNPILEFNPWRWSGTGGIAAAFFRELGLLLAAGKGKKSGERARKLEAYSKVLNVASLTASAAGAFVPGMTLLGTALGHAGNVSEKGADALETSASLTDLRTELWIALAALDRPIVVFIDDVDRLTSSEIREVFQLVKTNADFPNVVYVLLFDREVVADALDSISGNRGMKFMEKIINVGYHVPMIAQADIQAILFAGLDEHVEHPNLARRWQQDRWESLYLDCISHYFQNLRNVYRFLSSFDFTVRRFQTKDGFAVNPVDVIGIEAIRVFEPRLYENLPTAKTILTSVARPKFGAVTEQTVSETVNRLTRLATLEDKKTVEKLLLLLFPTTHSNSSPQFRNFGTKESWERDAQVCHTHHFDTYFSGGLDERLLSQVDVDRLVDSTANEDWFRAELAQLEKRDLRKQALQRLDAFKETIATEHIQNIANVLCDISDTFEWARRLLDFDEESQSWRLIYFCLRRESDEAVRYRVLYDSIAGSTSLYLPVKLVSHEERVADREAKGREFLVQESRLPSLRALCLEKIRTKAESGHLRDYSHFWQILWRWHEWAENECRDWIASQVKRATDAVWLIQLFLTEITLHGGRERNRAFVDLKRVETFVAAETIESLLEGLDESALSTQATLAVKEFRRSMACRTAGLPEPNHDNWGEPAENGNE